MSAIDQNLTILPITPAVPVVVVGSAFLHTLATVERDIAHLKITDADTAQLAAALQTRLTKAGAALEEARKVAKEPFLSKGREIDEAAKAPATRITAAKSSLSKMLVAYSEEQRKAEAARLAEIAALEAQRKAEAVPDELNLDGTPTEQRIAEISAPVSAKPAGISYRVTLFPHVEDVTNVPDAFLVKTVNMQAVRAAFCSPWAEGAALPVCGGIRFEIQKTAVSTGKVGF